MHLKIILIYLTSIINFNYSIPFSICHNTTKRKELFSLIGTTFVICSKLWLVNYWFDTIINAYSVTSGLILIFKMYDLVIQMYCLLYRFSKFLICFFICIFHPTRINLWAMILRGSAGRICHLENVKSYMSYLQYTKIIKILTLKTYFS